MVPLLIVLLTISTVYSDQTILFRDNFDNIKQWQSFKFGRDKKESTYSIDSLQGIFFLRAESRESASGLIGKWRFNPHEYPHIKWRWKVTIPIPVTHGRSKDTDDYAMRIFILFEDEAREMSLWDKIQHSFVKMFYGFDPPQAAISYVWSNIGEGDLIYDSPYSSEVKIICLRTKKDIDTEWKEEHVNVVDDYIRIFGKIPPAQAAVAIMCDSDNTSQNSEAFLDYISVSK